MTKSEVLKLDEPSAIWAEMQKNPELRADGEVWLHMTRLSAKKDREWSEKTYGDPEAYLYMDLNRKNNLSREHLSELQGYGVKFYE